MSRRMAVLLCALALSGCSLFSDLRGGEPARTAAPVPELESAAAPRVAAVPRPPERPTATPAQMVARAAELARSGQAGSARDLYWQVIESHPRDAVRPRALWGLAQLLADPASPAHDYRASVATFDRLSVEYPGSELAPDARLWRAVLAELVAREEEHARQRAQSGEEIARLRAQSGEEIARLRAQIQRLKRIDVDLERRR